MGSESLFTRCKGCGKDVSKSAKICPDCGAKLRKLTAIHWAGIVLGLIVVVAIFSTEDNSGNASRNTDISGTAANGTNQIAVPEKQSSFSNVVADYTARFGEARNELQQSTLRNQRQADIANALGDYTVDSWVGTISNLATNSEGKAILSVTISPEIRIKTWNNAFSDIASNTLIEQGTPVYEALFNLSNGQRVIFSGSFFPSRDDFIQETSLTISGSMRSPEFLFRFTSVTPIN